MQFVQELELNKMKNKIFFLILGILLVIFPLISSDVISVNGGGNDNLVVTPNQYTEGFFFGEGCVATTCSLLGYNCGNWSDGCGGTISCGSLNGECASGYSCSSGVCTVISTGGGDTGGGGGGGGGVSTPTITLNPSQFTINMKVSTNVERTVEITNTGSTSADITIYANPDFKDKVILQSDTLSLAPGETKTFKITFVAPSTPGTYAGTINFGGVLLTVSLSVKTELLLFDSNIVVLNDNYQVPQGSNLKTRVTLIPMGDKSRLDVTLNYAIKDFSGNVYLTKSETLLIEDQQEFDRNFDTGALPLGKYVVSLDLIYPNGVAPSSAQFEVIEPLPLDIVGTLIWVLIILILLTLIIILVIMIIRYLKQRKEENEA